MALRTALTSMLLIAGFVLATGCCAPCGSNIRGNCAAGPLLSQRFGDGCSAACSTPSKTVVRGRDQKHRSPAHCESDSRCAPHDPGPLARFVAGVRKDAEEIRSQPINFPADPPPPPIRASYHPVPTKPVFSE